MVTECPGCKESVPRSWLAREFDCPSCGATLRVDDSAAKSFIYRTEAILNVVGFFSSSSETYLLLGGLAILALVVYVARSWMSPLCIARQGC